MPLERDTHEQRAAKRRLLKSTTVVLLVALAILVTVEVPTEGEWPEGYYRSYEIKQRSEGEHGSFVAPFTGQHGWYWRNLSDVPASITLSASGYYSRLGRIEGAG